MLERKNFKTKLDTLCSTDKMRPAMTHVFFDKGNAVCTNAHVLIVQSLESHGFTYDEIKQMEGKVLHKDAFKEIYKYHRVYVENGQFVCHNKKNTVTSKFDLKELDYKYPDYRAVIPKAEQGGTGVARFNSNNFTKVANCLITPDYVDTLITNSGDLLIKSVSLTWEEETALIMRRE